MFKTSMSGCSDKGNNFVKDSISSCLGSPLYGGRSRELNARGNYVESKFNVVRESSDLVVKNLNKLLSFVQIQACFSFRLFVYSSRLASGTMMSLIFYNSVDSNTTRKDNGCIHLFVQIIFILT